MRILHERAAIAATVLFLALAISQGGPTQVLAAIAAVAVAGMLVRQATLVVGGRVLTVGRRARAHKEALSDMPAPRHPSTAGRPRTRAPSLVAAAA